MYYILLINSINKIKLNSTLPLNKMKQKFKDT